MDTPCTKAQAIDGEHRLEFQEYKNRETTWLCLDCGETVHQFQDGEGG